MTAVQLLQVLSQAVFLLVFVVALIRVARYPHRINVDIALLFGDISLAVVTSVLLTFLLPGLAAVAAVVASILIMALPYLLLRLVDDFAGVPGWLMRLAEAGLALAVVIVVALPPPAPLWVTLALVGYFVALEVYSGARFAREASVSTGTTRRRMQALALGTAILGLDIFVAGLAAAVPALQPDLMALTALLSLFSGLSYVVGFAPPAALRHAWQTPELRRFLRQISTLSRLPDRRAIALAFQEGAASAIGTTSVRIGLWGELAHVIRFFGPGESFDVMPGELIAGQVFASQRPLFSTNAAAVDPANAELYRRLGVTSILATPISAANRHLGVLIAYAPRAPIFGEDDLSLIQLLADQAAVVLENRALIDEVVQARSREEATRLKDDFLSAAAHDLKTPLTTMFAQAQLLERRALRDPQGPPDVEGIQRIIRESRRLSGLVLELLDVSTSERTGFRGSPEETDIAELARRVCQRQTSERHRCLVDASGPTSGHYDPQRLEQVLDSLVENAVKYSPDGGEVRVTLRGENGRLNLTVADQGIGIPPGDLGHVFERFRRATNVDDRRFAGMGLGLYVCQQIVDQYGGRIWASSPPRQGTTIHVSLPV